MPSSKLKLHGTYRKDVHGERERCPRPIGIPEMPKGLTKTAKEHWESVVPGLVATGVAKECDSAALAEMCRAWSDLQALNAENDPVGLIYKLKTARDCWSRLAGQFGLTPAMREKITVGDPKDTDPAAEFIA